jgi:alcohol dehydrogenase (cytochrome c)
LRNKTVVVATLLVVALGLATAISGRIRVRLEVLGLKLIGRLPSIRTTELYPLLRPGGGFDVDGLARTRNPLASLVLPRRFAAESSFGAVIYQKRCSDCHGLKAEGRVGPSLAEGARRHGGTDWASFVVIRDGAPGTAMRPSGLSFTDTWRVIAYLRSLEAPAGKRTGGGESGPAQLAPVSEAELAAADSSAAEWLGYNGGWSGRRHRETPALTAASVKALRLAWAYQLPADPANSQSTPIAVRGLVIVTTAQDVIALSQASGAVVWRFHREVTAEVNLCCSRSNRGAGVFGSQVFVGTLDAHLLALDLATGGLQWDVQVASPAEGFSIMGAPFLVDGRVIIGVGGGEFGVRGFLDAYEPVTGRRLWRFHTIPGPGEPGRETWPGGSFAPGGGATWVPGAYDPGRHLLYWGVGNPAPDFAADVRPGDNLYTNSVIALDVRTGTLRWTYQFTPNDSHDWDSAQTPVLVDLAWNGRVRSVLLWANRNGYFYVLDRATGEFLRATPFVKQNWNDGFDSAGRPRSRPAVVPSTQGSLVYPGIGGATNWWPPSFSDRLGLMFVAVREEGSLYFREPDLRADNGQLLGGRTQPVPGEDYAAAIVAIDVASGIVRWRTPAAGPTALMGGLLSIADRLVLGGQGTEFFALDGRTGRRIWQTSLGAPVQGAPIVFQTAQATRVAVTAGSVLFVFEIPESRSGVH